MRGSVAKRINELVPNLPKTFVRGNNTPGARRIKKKIWNLIPRSKRGKVRKNFDDRDKIISDMGIMNRL